MVSEDLELEQQVGSDKDAFFKLYDKYFDFVYRYAVRRVGQSEQLKKLVNRTFYRAYYQLNQFVDSRASFKIWILRYAKIVADEMGSPMRADVDDILVDLEQQDLEIVFFKVYEEFSDGEVAYILDVDESAFTPLYYRLLARLKSKMLQNG